MIVWRVQIALTHHLFLDMSKGFALSDHGVCEESQEGGGLLHERLVRLLGPRA